MVRVAVGQILEMSVRFADLQLLLRDLLGSPVVVLVVRGDVALELARIAAVVAALHRGRYLLQRLNDNGRVLAVDKDPAAQAAAHELAESEPRFEFFHGSFAQLPHQLRGMGIDAVDGILLDLGVSSPQLDDGDRKLRSSSPTIAEVGQPVPDVSATPTHFGCRVA